MIHLRTKILIFLKDQSKDSWNVLLETNIKLQSKTLKTVFHPISIQREKGWINETLPIVFKTKVRCVWKSDESLFVMFYIPSQTINKFWRKWKLKFTKLNDNDNICRDVLNFSSWSINEFVKLISLISC